MNKSLLRAYNTKLLIKLLAYDYSVEYKKGKENKAVYALSRIVPKAKVLAIPLVQPHWVQEVQKSYELDDHCLDLITKLNISPQAIPHYSLQNGIIRVHGKVMIVKDDPLRTQLLNSFHNSALGGHSGERATYQD